MPRRKRQFLEDDDDSDSSQNSANDELGVFDEADPDARAERALFEDPYQRKKRKQQNSDWAKAPKFVSGEPMVLDQHSSAEEQASADEGKDEAADESEDAVEDGDEEEDVDTSNRGSPRVPEEDMEDAPPPTRSGIGASAVRPQVSAFSRGGIGSSTAAKSSSISAFASASGEALPSAFGAARSQRAFLRDNTPSSSRPATPLSNDERLHFTKISGTFGARMLAKMGWQAGAGLGVTGEGIVTPVESKVRPQKMGLAFKGFREKTEQSKAEARRRGEIISDDEDSPRKTKRSGADKAKRSDAWKKPKKIKIKVEHKSYEEIIAEAEQTPQAPGLGKIIDATGATPREVSSLADIAMASWTPSTDATRIPEVRHNVRLICDACKGDLDGLAREAKALRERRQWLVQEDVRLRKKVEEEAELIARLQQIHLITEELEHQSKDLSSNYEATLDPFTPLIQKLSDQFPTEFEKYCLDEIIVAAIAPLFRRMVLQWQPLEEPTKFIPVFETWRKALRLTERERVPQDQMDVYGSSIRSQPVAETEKSMTPFDSLFWNIWLPRVRSSINNDWAPQDPKPAVELYEAWSAILPEFIRDNMLDQLIIPKVHKAIAEWNPRTARVSLRAIVFPWLPHVGLRLEEFVGDSRRKVKSLLRAWAIDEPIPADLEAWKDTFDSGEWDAIMLKYIVPKLGATLRNDFRINPRNQDMSTIQRVLAWATLLRPSIFSQLLIAEFFPKWLDVLHLWLIQPTANHEEVLQWYKRWTEIYQKNVQNLEGITPGFNQGLHLINQALDMSPDARTRLPRPDHTLLMPRPTAKKSSARAPPSRVQEVTFRSIVEEVSASHNLLFLPTGKAHEISRMPLYRVSPTEGKGGILVYILDDAVWAADGDTYRAISLEDMVARAND